jgi:hypothetical protein
MAYLAIPFDVDFRDGDGLPISGAAPTITIRNSSGVAVVTSAVMTEYTSETGAAYMYNYTPVAGGTYRGTASTADPDASMPVVLIGNATAVEESSGATPEEIAAAVWVYDPRTLTSTANAYVISPINPVNQLLTIVAFDSYTTGVDDTPLDFESADFPILTGGAIEFNARHQSYADDTFSKAGTVISASIARVELTSAETGGMLAGLWSYELVAILSDSTIRTLVTGQMEVITPIPGGV